MKTVTKYFSGIIVFFFILSFLFVIKVVVKLYYVFQFGIETLYSLVLTCVKTINNVQAEFYTRLILFLLCGKFVEEKITRIRSGIQNAMIVLKIWSNGNSLIFSYPIAKYLSTSQIEPDYEIS